MYAKKMPKLDLDLIKSKMTPAQFAIVKGIVSTRGENKGCLRASKPKTHKTISVPAKDPRFEGDLDYVYEDLETATLLGYTAYIWRMVAFQISPKSQHHCMPCTADWSIPGTYREIKDTLKVLDKLTKTIVDTVNPQEWHGVKRWGQVYGVVGTPVVTPEGAIVYR